MSAATDLLNSVGLGPQGGNLGATVNPEGRRTSLNAKIDPATGLPGLHRKEFVDTCAPGRDKEPPWARMAAFMLLQGRTNSEIGMAAGVHPGTVSQIRAQRWFQELLATLANEEGEVGLAIMKSECVASIQKVIELRDSSENERVALAAATFIIEQVQGKAVQRNMNVNASTTFDSPDAEMRNIQEQLSALRAARQNQPILRAQSEPEQKP